ncbi:MAG: hypothetical protein IT384_22805 [Deltaproteobacteria bacterium]|nr:hypothetical protein [Deltaproteobacteria bacterium]
MLVGLRARRQALAAGAAGAVLTLVLAGCAALLAENTTTHSGSGGSRFRRARIEAWTSSSSAEESTETTRTALPWENDRALEALATKLGAESVPIEIPCVDGSEDDCTRRALDRSLVALDLLQTTPERSVHVLQLGDSHIAADYITGTVRALLQERFGRAGRGFVHADQRQGYGGRRIKNKGGWTRARIVDSGQAGQRFGFSGFAMVSTRAGVPLEFALDDDERVTLFYDAGPGRPELQLSVDGALIGRVSTADDQPETQLKSVAIPPRESARGPDRRILRVNADGAGARLFGLGFTQKTTGLLWDSIGPVGADAAVYLSLDPASYREHLALMRPALVVLMLGGNDALRMRQKRATAAQVRREFAALIDRTREAVPEADCMLWGPMDAGDRKGNQIVSKSLVGEVRDLMLDVAREKGCAYWDLYRAMGGEGSIAVWSKENIINADLIHPRAKAGELIGYLFAKAFYRAYRGS